MRFSELLQFITPRQRTLALLVLLLLLESAVALSHPWMAGQLTRSLLNESPGTPAQVILLAWLGLLAARSVIGFSSHYLIGGTGEEMAASLRQRIVDHQLRLSLTDYHARQPGDLLALLSNDAGIVSNFVTQTLVQLLPLVLTFAGAAVMIARLNPVFALLAVLAAPGYLLVMVYLGRKIRPLGAAWINAWSAMIARVEENLGLLPAIKAFTREALESDRFASLNSHLLKLSKQQLLIQSALSPIMGLLAGAGLLLLLWFGTRRIESGQLQTFELVSLILYAMLMTRPLAALAGVYGQIMQTRGAAERLLGFFALGQESGKSAVQPLRGLKGTIEFQDVSFAYPGKPPLLKSFNLRIEAGESITLSGPNGAGKSTLAHLLMRFLEPTSGRILIDGVNIQQLEPIRLRANIALVAQQTLLQNATVAENISWGRPDAGPEAIREAAGAAGADEFIQGVPEKYATPIGHQGHRLSGGQRQRLALARALLKDPAILILDEATAMLDPEAEQHFLKSCRELLCRQTVIFISHHPVSQAFSDRSLRIEHGKLVLAAEGTGQRESCPSLQGCATLHSCNGAEKQKWPA